MRRESRISSETEGVIYHCIFRDYFRMAEMYNAGFYEYFRQYVSGINALEK